MKLSCVGSCNTVWETLQAILSNQSVINASIEAISGGGGVATSITSGTDIVVAVAGTAVQGPNIPATRGVLVVGRAGNTGNVFVGGSDVTNKSGTKKSIILTPLGMPSQFIPVDNANKVWVNADNANDSVGIVAL